MSATTQKQQCLFLALLLAGCGVSTGTSVDDEAALDAEATELRALGTSEVVGVLLPEAPQTTLHSGTPRYRAYRFTTPPAGADVTLAIGAASGSPQAWLLSSTYATVARGTTGLRKALRAGTFYIAFREAQGRPTTFTVALSFGATGDAGTPGCAPETDAQLCAARGYTCGQATVDDRCGVSRSPSCGACTATTVCGANGLVHHCGTVHHFTAAETDGRAIAIWPALVNGDMTALHAVSDTETWLSSTDTVLRVKPGSVQAYFLPGYDQQASDERFWSSAPDDVWLLRGAELRHFNGTSWSLVSAGFDPDIWLSAITGTARDDVWVAGWKKSAPVLRHFDGSNWANWSVAALSEAIDDLQASARGTPWVLQGGRVYKWNGLSFVPVGGQVRSSSSQRQRFALSASGTPYVLTITRIWSAVQRFDGTQWVGVYEADRGNAWSVIDSPMLALAGDALWFTNEWGEGVRLPPGATTPPVTMSGPFVAPRSATSGFVATAHGLKGVLDGHEFDRYAPGTPRTCQQAFADGQGGAWLRCGESLGRVDARGFTDDVMTGVATVFASPTTSVWVGLKTGALVRRASDGTLTTWSNYLGSSIVGVTANDDSDVWVVTATGGAAHFDGVHFVASTVPVSQSPLVGVVSSRSAVYAYGPQDVFDWTGSAWRPVRLPSGLRSITSVALLGGALWLAYATASRPELGSWNGLDWTLEAANTWAIQVTTSGHTVVSLEGTGELRVWTASGACTTLGVIKDEAWRLHGLQWLVMTDPTEVLFQASTVVSRLKF